MGVQQGTSVECEQETYLTLGGHCVQSLRTSGRSVVGIIMHKCGAHQLAGVGNPLVLPLEFLEIVKFMLWMKD